MSYPAAPLPDEIDRDGFSVARAVVDAAAVARWVELLSAAARPNRPGAVYAIRNLLAFDEIRREAESGPLQDVAVSILGSDAFPVAATLFDKPPTANWGVPCHQDLTIAVREERAIDGFGPWTRKAGVVHVQSPPAILARMLAVRLHLDDCGAADGPLRVIAGSHRDGRLDSAALEAFARKPFVTPSLAAGDCLLMRPLLLHGSSRATAGRRRRVVHLEYACDELPGGLQWRWRHARR